jgi:glycerol-3-phosphate acyltransferase PlsY
VIHNTAFTCAAAGYVLGSIPFGYLLVRIFRGEDVRATGSGNIGATNVARSSRGLGIATLLLDFLKGAAAVWLASRLFSADRNVQFLAGCAAICGHVFPVWLGFRGGKGVATGLGAFSLLTPKAIIAGIGVFLAAVAACQYVSLASMLAWVTLLASAFILGAARGAIQEILVCFSSLLIIVKHRRNIGRLVSGTEPKFHLRRK